MIRRLTRDMAYPIEIIDAPTLRETSGLAMSSRNQYLDPIQRERAAFIHATLLRMREAQRDAAELIRAVASPGGTTEAALRRFAEHGFSDIVAAALHAASDRSRELGRGSN